MLSRFLPALFLGTLLLPSWQASAAPPSIQLVVPAFDYPQAGVINTMGVAISNNGTIAGTVTTPLTSGYKRFPDGSYSPTFVFPGAQATYVSGVNSSGVVSGTYYTISTEIAHGFFYDGATFTQYDVPGMTYTNVTGINDAGDFCGYSSISSFEDEIGFVSIGGVLQTFTIPGVSLVQPRGVNNKGQVAGTYYDQQQLAHGFFRDADGTLTYPIDPRASRGTMINGLNDKGLLVGTSSSSTGAFGFVLKLPRRVVTYMYPDPDADNFSVRAINNSGMITGFYRKDSSFHGFIGRLVR